MKEKQSWMDRLDEKRDAIGAKLSEKEVRLPVDLVTGAFSCFWEP